LTTCNQIAVRERERARERERERGGGVRERQVAKRLQSELMNAAVAK
jgi:hypothetical protein